MPNRIHGWPDFLIGPAKTILIEQFQFKIDI